MGGYCELLVMVIRNLNCNRRIAINALRQFDNKWAIFSTSEFHNREVCDQLFRFLDRHINALVWLPGVSIVEIPAVAASIATTRTPLPTPESQRTSIEKLTGVFLKLAVHRFESLRAKFVKLDEAL
tara:strand:- start:311 stop:688 length:378 start_codon:yes stop_codon:yes gene_type:complete